MSMTRAAWYSRLTDLHCCLWSFDLFIQPFIKNKKKPQSIPSVQPQDLPESLSMNVYIFKPKIRTTFFLGGKGELLKRGVLCFFKQISASSPGGCWWVNYSSQ